MRVVLKSSMNLKELILRNWGTSSVGLSSILLGVFGNLTIDDFQTYIDWFNNVMAQDNKLMRLGLIAAGIAGLLSRDPRTPKPPPLPGVDLPSGSPVVHP